MMLKAINKLKRYVKRKKLSFKRDSAMWQFKSKLPCDLLDNYGFIYIGHGATRMSFGNDDYVIKIGKRSENENEFEWYKKIQKHSTLKYSVVPMFHHIGVNKTLSIIIAARAQHLKPTKDLLYFADKRRDKQRLLFHPFYPDNYTTNVLKFGSGLVMVDLNLGIYNNIKNKDIEKWKKAIHFSRHKRTYDALYKKLKFDL